MGLDCPITVRHGQLEVFLVRPFLLPVLAVLLITSCPGVLCAQGLLELKNTELDFASADSLKVELLLPDNFIINSRVPTEIELTSADGSYKLKSPLAAGVNTIKLGDISALTQLSGTAKVFYCQASETFRCFLKKPRISLQNAPGLKSPKPLAIKILPH